jgi:hypothetical protein
MARVRPIFHLLTLFCSATLRSSSAASSLLCMACSFMTNGDASLVGLGALSAFAALAYMIFAFDYRGVSISQSDDEDNGENFQHNSAIVPTDRIPVDFKLGNSQGGESLDVRCQI